MNASPASDLETSAIPLSGTEAQVEWAVRIRRQVKADFDRVASAFRSTAKKQIRAKRADTDAILAILEEKRSEVMGMTRAGYFIQEWQEIGDQVRKLIFRDPRYEAIKGKRAARSNTADKTASGRTNNIMNIRPLYDRIVVKRIEEQETSRNGIIIPDSAQEKPQEGEIVSVGRGKLLEDGQVVALDVKAGDRVLFGKYSGTETKLVGTEYIIMREDDILAVLTKVGPAAVKTA